ncbi:MAG: DNA-binding protein WhiA [Synergistaceae bacterium]|nr:DNA-binding protein WhiA [Synergistaceae bacterium]
MDKSKLLANIWDEWLISPVNSTSAADFEASGLLLGMRHSNNSNTFTTNRLRTARRLTGPGRVRLWAMTSYSEKFNLELSMITRKNHKPAVKFICPRELLRTPRNLRASWSWLKGLWGSCGGLYSPKAGYYLTLIISDEEISELARNVLALTGLNWSEHRNEFTLRNHDDITTFLYKTGIQSGALALEDTAIIRNAKNRANLASNYDSANIARSVKAAHEQSILAHKILDSGLFEALPPKLRELVELRLSQPDATLDELGKKINPPITKSAVKYRWEKIHEFIKNFITEEKNKP